MKRFFCVVLIVIMVLLAGCAEKQSGVVTSVTSIDEDTLSIPAAATGVTEASATENVTDAEETEYLTEEQTDASTEAPGDELDVRQSNSVAMLNYLSLLSQEINASKNSRLFMEEVYASLINNIQPGKVNEMTESHLSDLLDIIEQYRMINIKRERIRYFYEQSKANAFMHAIPPDAESLIGFIIEKQKFGGLVSVLYMAVDVATSYMQYTEELDQSFLQEGWALDDEAAEALHNNRKNGFMFMLDIVREENLPGELALSEKAIADFVSWKNKTNIEQKIHFFESEEKTYKDFPYYWLELSNVYWEHGDWQRCIDAFHEYEKIRPDILRKDYYMAKAIPGLISAALNLLPDGEYAEFTSRYLQIMLDNTDNNDWATRYFAAVTYLDLYVKTEDAAYLQKAYDQILLNINHLVDDQRSFNNTYINDVVEVKASDNADKDEKNQIKDYNKSLHEKRKTELPPIYEPLQLNCELLFVLAEKLNITQAEKTKISGILRDKDNPALFLTDTVESKFSFTHFTKSYDAEYNKTSFTIPASCVSERSKIEVTVKDGDSTTFYKDWTVDSVIRESKDISGYKVVYVGNDIKNQKWSENSTVKISVYDYEDDETPSVVLNFKVSKYTTVPFLGWELNVTFEQIK